MDTTEKRKYPAYTLFVDSGSPPGTRRGSSCQLFYGNFWLHYTPRARSLAEPSSKLEARSSKVKEDKREPSLCVFFSGENLGFFCEKGTRISEKEPEKKHSNPHRERGKTGKLFLWSKRRFWESTDRWRVRRVKPLREEWSWMRGSLVPLHSKVPLQGACFWSPFFAFETQVLWCPA